MKSWPSPCAPAKPRFPPGTQLGKTLLMNDPVPGNSSRLRQFLSLQDGGVVPLLSRALLLFAALRLSLSADRRTEDAQQGTHPAGRRSTSR